MKPTDISTPDYFHKVVDCQWACPAHTPVPEYIRLIAAGRYSDAYMVNWKSNVFPGILGRTCDRPCEPACRRVRVENEPVAICRLKRQAHRAGGRRPRLAHGRARPRAARLSLRGVRPGPEGRRHDPHANPALPSAGIHHRRGMRLHPQSRHRISRRQAHRQPQGAAGGGLGCGLRRLRRAARPRSRHSRPQGSGGEHPYRHRLAFVGLLRPRQQHWQARDRARRRQHRHGLLPLVAPPRRRRREGGRALGLPGNEGVPLGKGGRHARGYPDPEFPRAERVRPRQRPLTGVLFEKVKAEYDAKGRRNLVPTGEPDQHMACDDVLVAVGQENAFPWIERDIGVEFDKWDMPKVDPKTMASTHPRVFFGGDSAFGPKNIIWAVAHGHDAALSIDKLCSGADINDRPLPMVEIVSQKMGIHEWSYDNDIAPDRRYRVPLRDKVVALRDIKAEVELGYDVNLALKEAHRCLNCDVQTVFTSSLCIECDACVDICPMDCITFTP